MYRAVPAYRGPSARELRDAAPHGVKRREYTLELLTPLVGGGPEMGQNDPVTLIRPTVVRGQLRFWWRATRGSRFESATELAAREGAIWGTTGSASPVRVCIKNVDSQQAAPWARYEQGRNGLKRIPTPVNRCYSPYVLFPFMGKAEHNRVTQEPATVTTAARFTLALEWPAEQDLDKDVEAATWAWVNFGGVGARTRRGCGSVFCRQLAPGIKKCTSEDLNAWYRGKCEEYDITLPTEARPWPTLPPTLMIKAGTERRCAGSDSGSASLAAWYEVVELLCTFRQGVGVGRNPGGKVPGRSRWPEANTLRRLVRSGGRPGQTRTQDCGAIDAFPRAEFGLPIVFHFNRPRADPPDCTLSPASGSKRMASPLILKALAVVTDHGTTAVPMIMRLQTQQLEGVVVEWKAEAEDEVRRVEYGQDAIRNKALASCPRSPIEGRSKDGSALEAFEAFAREKGFS